MYIGSPMRVIEDVADNEIPTTRDFYRLQAWSFVIGHPRSIRQMGSRVFLDDESARGDVLYDLKHIWFKVHDIETSVEPPTIFYSVLGKGTTRHDDAVLANNIYVREYREK